jgi:hypothetical protein
MICVRTSEKRTVTLVGSLRHGTGRSHWGVKGFPDIIQGTPFFLGTLRKVPSKTICPLRSFY